MTVWKIEKWYGQEECKCIGSFTENKKNYIALKFCNELNAIFPMHFFFILLIERVVDHFVELGSRLCKGNQMLLWHNLFSWFFCWYNAINVIHVRNEVRNQSPSHRCVFSPRSNNSSRVFLYLVRNHQKKLCNEIF